MTADYARRAVIDTAARMFIRALKGATGAMIADGYVILITKADDYERLKEQHASLRSE
jgi:hypothetical protein